MLAEEGRAQRAADLEREAASPAPAPPLGAASGAWTLHCIRAGAASECNALDIAMSKIRRQGGWSAKSTVPSDVYIDPNCPHLEAGRRFFGWLMASSAM